MGSQPNNKVEILPEVFCRICFEGAPEADLISPCNCKGSQSYVHVACHRAWQLTAMRTENVRRAYFCSVCGSAYKGPYATVPLFDVQGLVKSSAASLRAAVSAAVSSLTLSPSWLLKSLLLVALSCSLPYAVLAYYGLALTLLANSLVPFQEHSVGLGPGRLLVATRRIPSTSVFHQSVVLLLEHSTTQGAKGVILNRPLPASFTASLLRDKPQGHTQGAVGEGRDKGEAEEGGPWSVSLGGPEEPDSLLVLHNDSRARWSKEVVSGVHVGRSLQELLLLTRLWDSEGSTRQPGHSHDDDEGGSHVARVMFGYSGWAPRQLENEIRRGDWLVAEASASDVLRAHHGATSAPSPWGHTMHTAA